MKGRDEVIDELGAHADNTRNHVNLAEFHAMLGDLAGLRTEASLVLSAAPENGGVRARLAWCYAFLGEHERAVELLDDALRKGYLAAYEIQDIRVLEETSVYDEFYSDYEKEAARLRSLY